MKKEREEQLYRENWNGSLLKCHICNKWLTTDNFNIAGGNKYNYRNGLDKRCSKCKVHQNKQSRSQYSDSKKLNKIFLTRYHHAKSRALSKNIDFNLTVEYIQNLWKQQNGKCAITKLNMTYELDSGRIPTNLSIDRIDSNQGYTLNNIHLVCMAVNQLKLDFDMEIIYMILRRHIKSKR